MWAACCTSDSSLEPAAGHKTRLPKLSNRMARASLLLIAALCFVNAHFAVGYGLHKMSEEEIELFRHTADAEKLESHDRKLLGLQQVNAHEKDDILAAIRANEHEGHSRKLLAGTACLSHATWTSNLYYGECPAFTKKDESHWCSAGVSYGGYQTSTDLCIAESEDECCPTDGGAVAGLVIGLFVGITGIITLFAFCCKCCCFRPKPVVIMQQPVMQQQTPQVIVVPASPQ